MFDQLTDAQRHIQQVARTFAEAEVAPQAAAHSREARFPEALLRRAGELGLLGILVPREYGGSDLGNLAQTLVLEEINRACASTGVTVSVHASLVCVAIRRYATPALQRRYLPALGRGELLGAYCLTEPHSGSDAAALSTSARRDGDAWVLDGTKMFITTGKEAGVYVVFARTDAHKTRGITAFLVDRDTPGLGVGKEEVKMGLSASHTVEILLEGCRVPDDHRLGEVGQGFPIAMSLLDGGRIGIAAQALGIGQACLDATARYALGAQRDGKPLAWHQSVQHALADMATDVEAARHLTWHAARRRDAELPCTREASMAKLFASQAANRAAARALEVHGAAGIERTEDVERYFRDARVTTLYEGTTEIQKLVVARQVLKAYENTITG